MTPNERPTPLTDAAKRPITANWNNEGDERRDVVFADFARALERSLAERTKELESEKRSHAIAGQCMMEERDTALAKLAAFSSGYVDSKQHNAMAKKLAKCRESLERLEEVGILCQRAEEARYSDARIFARQALEETK
jgi:hypothetical protein